MEALLSICKDPVIKAVGPPLVGEEDDGYRLHADVHTGLKSSSDVPIAQRQSGSVLALW